MYRVLMASLGGLTVLMSSLFLLKFSPPRMKNSLLKVALKKATFTPEEWSAIGLRMLHSALLAGGLRIVLLYGLNENAGDNSSSWNKSISLLLFSYVVFALAVFLNGFFQVRRQSVMQQGELTDDVSTSG